MKLSGTHWDETECSMDTWNLFQTRVKPVLVCSVNWLLDFIWLGLGPDYVYPANHVYLGIEERAD